ncbi:hypothetical protein HPB49_009099 [Dermacentor silvarum]|uniref:Uncharacterized protein n=1 Tax=Dermacentor silvarum TaxID=543639 RepID=A0ACB8C2S6_DERSI|nr:hypothetical protein HPB49_009099 [Dermacentor silvarum]
MKMVAQWYALHDIGVVKPRGLQEGPFYSSDDERLCWLEVDFVGYLEDLQMNGGKSTQKMTKETYEATLMTTRSTVALTEYLLDHINFRYVLTRGLNSDPVESLFSSLRQFNGGNDRVDARAAVFTAEKLLKVGILQAAQSANAPTTSEMKTALKQAIVGDETAPLPDVINFATMELASELGFVKLWSGAEADLEIAPLIYLAGYLARVCEEKEEQESVRDYLVELRRLAADGTFGATLDRMLRDRIVCGMRDEKTRRYLLARKKLTCEEAGEFALASEKANEDACGMRDSYARAESGVVNMVHQPQQGRHWRKNITRQVIVLRATDAKGPMERHRADIAVLSATNVAKEGTSQELAKEPTHTHQEHLLSKERNAKMKKRCSMLSSRTIRTTPIREKQSPAEMLLGCQPRTHLSTCFQEEDGAGKSATVNGVPMIFRLKTPENATISFTKFRGTPGCHPSASTTAWRDRRIPESSPARGTLTQRQLGEPSAAAPTPGFPCRSCA